MRTGLTTSVILHAAVLAFLILRSASESIRTAAPGVDRDNLTGALAAAEITDDIDLGAARRRLQRLRETLRSADFDNVVGTSSTRQRQHC